MVFSTSANPAAVVASAAAAEKQQRKQRDTAAAAAEQSLQAAAADAAAGAADGSGAYEGALLRHEAPYGVAYLVATWLPGGAKPATRSED